jgi:hypothetical protein
MVAVRAVNMCESSSKNNVENSEEIFSLWPPLIPEYQELK